MAVVSFPQMWMRLKREGKEEEARTYYWEQYEKHIASMARFRGPKAAFAKKKASMDVAKKFKPDSAAEARVARTEEMARQLRIYEAQEIRTEARLDVKQEFKQMDADLRQEQLAEQQAEREAAKQAVEAAKQAEEEEKAARARELQSMVITQLEEKTDSETDELPGPIAWALNHMHMIGAHDEPGTWSIFPKDAPSAAAWNMLMYSSRATKDFMSMVFREMTKRQEEREKQRIWEEQQRLKKAIDEKGTTRADYDGKIEDGTFEEIKKMMGKYNGQT